MSDCRTGCLSKDHESYAACLRDAAPRVAFCNSASGQDYTLQKKWDRDLDAYRAARREGIQPTSTRPADVTAALRASDSIGAPFRADQ